MKKLLSESAKRVGNIACMGIDPVVDKIPLKGKPEEVIVEFYTNIFNAMQKEGVSPAAFKPNIAFFEQYGLKGLEALQKILAMLKEFNVPIILDAKRGDIGRTSTAYANAVKYWGADAVTVAPYMGSDSVQPFGESTYVLCRTSNKGAEDLQNLIVGDEPLFMKTGRKIIEWKTGAVVGATYPNELRELALLFLDYDTPLLIPGVGKQGGSATEVMDILKNVGYDVSICRINSSSAISFASAGTDYAEAAVKALKDLLKETNIN